MGAGEDVEQRLNEVWSRVSASFDMSASRVEPGIKGGRSREGAVFDRYISFKDDGGRNLDLAVFRIGSTGALECEVSVRSTKGPQRDVLHRRRFSYSQFESAAADFEEQLALLAVRKS